MDIAGEGTGSLSFTAQQGDVFRVGLTNEFGNYRTSVLIYDTFFYDVNGQPSAPIFGGAPFRLESFSEIPTTYPTAYHPLKTDVNKQAFWFAENTFQDKGLAGVGYKFAIYQTPRGEAPQLQGYFCWDPEIRVI